MSVAGSSALQDSSIKNNRDINKFLKNPNQDIVSLEDSLFNEASNKLKDKMMNEFPIFAFNEDYLKTISMIL